MQTKLVNEPRCCQSQATGQYCRQDGRALLLQRWLALESVLHLPCMLAEVPTKMRKSRFLCSSATCQAWWPPGHLHLWKSHHLYHWYQVQMSHPLLIYKCFFMRRILQFRLQEQPGLHHRRLHQHRGRLWKEAPGEASRCLRRHR